MEQSSAITRKLGLTKPQIRIIFISCLGGALEFYDFMVFIFLASIVSTQFFPMKNEIDSLLAFFATFMAGYLARPIGGVIFSHFGDLYGPKQTLYYSIMLMAVPSLLIALLPTYKTIGVLAPILLVAFRLIQGAAVGGELPGAVTLTFESVTKKRRGLSLAFLFFALSLSILFGQGVVALLHTCLTMSELSLWGWRIAFALGALLGFVGGYLRRNVVESPVFQAFQTKQQARQLPFFRVFQKSFIPLLQALSILCMMSVGLVLIFIYMPTYLLHFKHINPIPAVDVQWLNSLNLAVFSIVILLVGFLSDYVGRKKVIILGLVLLIIFVYPVFYWIQVGTEREVCLTVIFLGMMFSLLGGTVIFTR